MEYRIVWGGDPEDVLIATSGDGSVDDLYAAVREVINDLRFLGVRKVLADHTQTKLWAISNDEIHRLAELIKHDADKLNGLRVAEVVGSPVDDGLEMVFRALIAEHVPFVQEIFHSVSAAGDWLRND